MKQAMKCTLQNKKSAKKKKIEYDNPMVKSAYELLKKTADNDDPYTSYGLHIANELKKYDKATKLKEIDPSANAASAKKKIENLRISYIRESKKEQQIGRTNQKKLTRERNIEIKKEKLIDAANDLLTNRRETNAFGVYVGKKMEEIPAGARPR
ncbi:unnamed protein product [Parnassius apollo]|uniref:(apollo) hypothetical protein n=1 Tax=Parnassius apollo TaxID=110799 RepID=A0A8S3XFN1_PARAO|nr:unnamed protein product [Parnassius apollo]